MTGTCGERLRRLLCALPLVMAAMAAPAAEPEQSWNFRVYLDNDPIGYHNFTLTAHGEVRELKSVAHYQVKILFVTAYAYDHHATEIWRGDCLERLDSDSDDDGKRLSVHARREGEALAVDAPEGHYSLAGCSMSFAYWNPLMLQQTHLINPETGEDILVTITASGEEDIRVRAAAVHAQRYHLHSAKLEIDLWYSAGGEWLALESPEKGRRLRYVLN
jgi:uncharacterized protein DUF6134